MKVVQLLCLLWILYLNTDVLGQTQRGDIDINGNTRNNELRYGRGQGERKGKASPEPVLTERNIFQALCTHCKNRNPKNANCLSVCLESNNTDSTKAFASQIQSRAAVHNSGCRYYRRVNTGGNYRINNLHRKSKKWR